MIQQTKSDIKSASQLFATAHDGNRLELVKGVLIVMSPAGGEHGRVASRILIRLGTHVEANNLGETFAAETGFLIETDPDTVRAPDASFVSHERMDTVEDTSAYPRLLPIWSLRSCRQAIRLRMSKRRSSNGLAPDR